MKLVFYGGGSYEDNKDLNERCLSLMGKKNPLATYIPAYSYGAEDDFKEFIRAFRFYRVRRFLYFPVDQAFDRILLRAVLKSDMIHLSGGDTYYFLKHLKKSGVFHHLKVFVKRGGLLTGLSAGGIVMCPDITPAGYPEFDRDDNEEGLTNLVGMNLARFEFFPHYKNSPRYEEELLRQSKKTAFPLLGVPDYNGLVVDGHRMEFFGRVHCFLDGKKGRLT